MNLTERFAIAPSRLETASFRLKCSFCATRRLLCLFRSYIERHRSSRRRRQQYWRDYPSQHGWRDHAVLFLHVRAQEP